MKVETAIRREQIIEAAIKRFSHFGISKTSLTEIAEDLAVSKQALAYYFADKQLLVAAVEEKIVNDYILSLKNNIEQADTIEHAVLKLGQVKSKFFEKYYMLALQSDGLEHISTSLRHWRESLREKEVQLLVPLFEKGIKEGELRPLDTVKTSELLLDTLYAFSRCVKDKGVLPTPVDFEEIFTKQQEVTRVFYNGLKQQPWKNWFLPKQNSYSFPMA